MTPALFALFTRSLREDTRSSMMVWARSGMAVAILFVMLQFRTSRLFGAAGRDFFEAVVAINAVFICVAMLSYFAGAITEEKEDGTLGLLRMTNLNPLTFLLGKSTSRLCGALLLLLVQFPFALLAVTLGGLRWEQVFACYTILAAFLFFGANVGLLGSVLGRRTPIAAMITGVIAAAFVLGGEFAEGVFESIFFRSWQTEPALAGIVEFWQRASIPRALGEVLYTRTPGWSPVGTTMLLIAGGCVAFAFAWLLFDRFCVDDSAVTASRFGPRSLRWLGFFFPRNHGRARTGSRLEAVVWKDFQFMHGGWRIAAVKIVGYFIGAVWLLFDEYGRNEKWGLRSPELLLASADLRNWEFQWDQYFPTLAGMTFAALCAEALFAASRIFRSERNQRTLSGLAALPHDLPELISAKRRAVVLSMLPVGGFFTVSLIGALGLNLGDYLTGNRSGFLLFFGSLFLIWTVGQFFLNLRLVAWFSLRMKWGGLPFALTLSFFTQMPATAVVALAFREGSTVIVPVVTWIVAHALKGALHRRIGIAASEN
jgi:ABC-type transport system involved in multi-copper enzyme maturation permease subunit